MSLTIIIISSNNKKEPQKQGKKIQNYLHHEEQFTMQQAQLQSACLNR